MTTSGKYLAWAGSVLRRHLAVGVSIGLALGIALGSRMPAETIAVFVGAGVWVALLRWLSKTNNGARHRRVFYLREPPDTACEAAGESTESSDNPPSPFASRLAQFLGCDESELQPARTKSTSKMRFWSLVSFGRWHGPKPRWRIRFLLERIRSRVRGGENRGGSPRPASEP